MTHLANNLLLEFADGIVVHQGASLHVAVQMEQKLVPMVVLDGLPNFRGQRSRIVLAQDVEHMGIGLLVAHLLLQGDDLLRPQLPSLVPEHLPDEGLCTIIDAVRDNVILRPSIHLSLLGVFGILFLEKSRW